MAAKHLGKYSSMHEAKQEREIRSVSLCWVNSMFSPYRSGKAYFSTTEHPSERQRSTFGCRYRARFQRWNSCSMVMPSTGNKEPQELIIPVVPVPDENSIMTPGELRQVSLEYDLFKSILKGGSTFFGCINSNECSSGIVGVKGALVTLLMVKAVEQEGNAPRVVLECRCSSRLAVLNTADEITDPKITMARVLRVRDHQEDSFSERREVSHLEWKLWNTCKEVSSLLRKLQTDRVTPKVVEQELAVWAPKAYDREIEEHEWEATPHVTRQVFWDRAECFSFGILRCMEGGDDVIRKARQITSTSERLRMALEFAQEKKAATCARLSLKNALD